MIEPVHLLERAEIDERQHTGGDGGDQEQGQQDVAAGGADLECAPMEGLPAVECASAEWAMVSHVDTSGKLTTSAGR